MSCNMYKRIVPAWVKARKKNSGQVILDLVQLLLGLSKTLFPKRYEHLFKENYETKNVYIF